MTAWNQSTSTSISYVVKPEFLFLFKWMKNNIDILYDDQMATLVVLFKTWKKTKKIDQPSGFQVKISQ